MTKEQKALEVIKSAKGDKCILMCSLGKDSLVLLDMITPHFKKVVCVFMYFVKDLEHINRWIRWVQAKYKNVEFVQIPHWSLTYVLKGGLYSVPNPNVRTMTLKDVVKSLRLKYNIESVFLGMKKADSMNRRLMLMSMENYSQNGSYYPLADYTQKEILAYMRQHNLPQPVRYSLAASNGVGFNLDCFLWLRENFPQDLEKIYSVFPLSRRILFEYDHKKGKQLWQEEKV